MIYSYGPINENDALPTDGAGQLTYESGIVDTAGPFALLDRTHPPELRAQGGINLIAGINH
ncbi:Hypothetical protein NGAL_HAMBI1145_59690 [Neorhizobium galegae bv. officinalis]|uniref:Uncharacterized protein n=1 Tax=Neorhizobium galegae bv. officinalis TaxID=323656 RepID=A0A0T7G2Z3_NEOGA|nr:Hypothetical protein NGAL_HAMBI1145_59690 [Neorhizobium galegae bv. officinalis]